MCPFGFDVARLRFVKITFYSFFFFFFQLQYLTKLTVNSARMHCSWVSQIPLFSNFFVKNEFHGTIYIFKNYFATVFSILAKINSIQTDPMYMFACTCINILVKCNFGSPSNQIIALPLFIYVYVCACFYFILFLFIIWV